MPKSDIHPEWYPEAKVYCDGEVVMTVGSTKPELSVDIWSGNHPFYTGTQKIIDTEGRVERFMRKYGMAEDQQAGASGQKKATPEEKDT
jgi:large subunit ribosomal protein L31